MALIGSSPTWSLHSEHTCPPCFHRRSFSSASVSLYCCPCTLRAFPSALTSVRSSFWSVIIHLNGSHTERRSLSKAKPVNIVLHSLGFLFVWFWVCFLILLLKSVIWMPNLDDQLVKVPDSKSVISVFLCFLMSSHTWTLVIVKSFYTLCSLSAIMPAF